MFESCMWTYIHQQREVLLNLLQNHNVEKNIDSITNIESIYCVAHGSSYNACLSVAPWISRYAKVRIYVYTPSSFKHNALSLHYEDNKKTAVLGVSQTGTSRGVLEVLEQVHDYKKIVVTNEKDSPIDQLGDITYYLQVGKEDSNAKTKGYSATLLILMVLGIELGYAKGNISIQDKQKIVESIQKEIEELSHVIADTTKWCTTHTYGKGMQNVCVLGNGMHYGSALEGALKLMETMCIPTTFNDIVEFSHGMHRYINNDSYVWLIHSTWDTSLIEKTYSYCRKQNIHTLMIDAKNTIEDEYVIHVGNYPYTSSLFSIVCVIQVLAVFVPEINGLDPNREANDEYTNYVETRVIEK